MKQAAVGDAWRRLRKRELPDRVKHVKVDGLAGFAAAGITLPDNGLAVLCGTNGTGKSTLLSTIHTGTARYGAFHRKALEMKSGQVDVTLTVVQSGHDRIVPVVVPNSEPDAPVDPPHSEILDPAEHVSAVEENRIDSSALDELLEGVEPRAASPAEIAEYEYVLRRKYDQVLTYEVEQQVVIGWAEGEPQLGDGDGWIPYFEVTSDGVTYGSERMGHGELAAFYLLWAIRRAATGSVLLLEEPEVFLAPFAQSNLLNVLAAASVERGFAVVITTQSEAILRAAPRDSVRLLVRMDGSTSVVTPGAAKDYLDALGVGSRISTLLFVEDLTAANFASSWLARADYELFTLSEVAAGQGVTSVRDYCKLPALRAVHVVGLLDGDQREVPIPAGLTWPVAFLPGNGGPEEIILSELQAAPAEVAAMSGRSVDQVRMAYANATGGDPHDWLRNVGDGLGGIPPARLVDLGVKLWLATAPGAAASEAALDGLHKAVSRAQETRPRG